MTNDIGSQRTLILGTGPFAQVLLMEIEARPHCGYQVIGMVSEQPVEAETCLDYPLLGTLRDLTGIVPAVQPDRIVVCLSERDAARVDHQLVEAKVCKAIGVEDGKDIYERLTGKLAIEALTPGCLLFTREFQPSAFSLRASRLMSLVFALAGGVLLAPLFALVALAIKLDSRGPVLFVQERVGLCGKRFRLRKFRTMHPTEQRSSEWEGDNVHRITRVGKWLRKFRLDELPQFFNVLAGDMNLVGPRPHPACNFELFVLVSRNTPECGGQIPYYSLRSLVRPGITGWAQVRYRYANNLDEEIEKLRFDLYYVKHYSLWLDLRILFETITVVLFGHRKEKPRARIIQTTSAIPAGLAAKSPAGGRLPGYARSSQRSAPHGNL